MSVDPLARRCFLFLQGPPGPFFRQLGAALRLAGHQVRRINLNGGDRLDWGMRAIDYRGTFEAWPGYFERFIRDHAVTDLVLFGDCRPMHQAAHAVAKLNALRIHVFEEGYLRPDWVTLELDGVNGHSRLSRDPDWYRAAARDLPETPVLPPVPSSFERRAGDAARYYAACVVGRVRFRHYRSHRPDGTIQEGLGWLGRLRRRRRNEERAMQAFAKMCGRPYFVLPLQLNSDHQILVHSPFGGMAGAISYVLENFARGAPDDVVLVIKEHPLDNGLINWRQFVARLVDEQGIAAERVVYLQGGDIAEIVNGARGVVTVNSTTGTLALSAGVPVTVLGQAVYDVPGITHTGSLDDFWHRPEAPDPATWDAFQRVLVDRCLVRGGFASDEGVAQLVAGSLPRLTAARQPDEAADKAAA